MDPTPRADLTPEETARADGRAPRSTRSTAVRHATAPRAAYLFTLLTALLTSAVIIGMAWRTNIADYEAENRALGDKAVVYSRMLSSHVERTFRQADVLARLVADNYLAEGDQLDLPRVVREGSIPIDVFLQIAVTDARGIVRGSTFPDWKPVDLSDRAHINVHFDRTVAPDFYVSVPLIGRVSRKPTVQYSRAVVDTRGALRGVVVISLSPSYFSSFFSTQDIGEHGVVTVFGPHDGIVRARRTGSNDDVGQRVPLDHPIVAGVAAGRSGVLQNHVSVVDGLVRTTAYHPVPGLPLGVAVGLEVEKELAVHHERARQLWLTALVAVIATVLLAFANLYYVRRWALSRALQVQAEIRRSRLEHRVSTIVEASPDGVMLVGAEQKVEAVNSAFRRMAGPGSAAVIGLSGMDALERLCRHRELHLPQDAAELLWDGAQAQGQPVLAKRRSSPPLVYELRAWPVEGETARVISIRDITAEHEIQRLKSEFVTTAAHELRTPMASVLGFSELLLVDDLPADQRREACVAIHRQASRLTVMLNDFLDLARVEARAGLDFRFAEVDVVALCRHAMDEFHYVAMDRDVAFEQSGDEPVAVWGDRTKLEQVLHNLLGNAMKYSRAPAPIRLKLARDDAQGHAVIEVIDQGIGMTPAQLARVFDGFYRADESGQTVGSGLGLVLAKRIVEVHRGTIDIRSEYGKGTVVTVRLPLAPSGDG